MKKEMINKLKEVADEMGYIRTASGIERYKWSWNMWEYIKDWETRIMSTALVLESQIRRKDD